MLYFCREKNKIHDIMDILVDAIVREKNGRRFKITPIKEVVNKSPFDVPGINTDISTNEMINFLKESRSYHVA